VDLLVKEHKSETKATRRCEVESNDRTGEEPEYPRAPPPDAAPNVLGKGGIQRTLSEEEFVGNQEVMG